MSASSERFDKGCIDAFPSLDVQVLLHWSLFPMLALLALARPALALGVVIVWLVHGAGHAWALRGLGVKVRAVRFNGLGGECAWDQTVGRSGLALVAWAGVGAQGILLIGWAAFRIATGFGGGPFMGGLDDALMTANAGLIVLNLLPLPGLDGEAAWTLLTDPKIDVSPGPGRRRAEPDPEELRRRAETERVFQKMLDELTRPMPADRRDDDE